MIISSFKERDLLHFFELYSQCFLPEVTRQIKKISYNCYEAQLIHAALTFNGYGKNNNEAMASAILNLIHKLLDQHEHAHNIKECIRRYTVTGQYQPTQKVKTLPDAPSDKKIHPKQVENSLQPKDNPLRTAQKTIKDEIF